MDFIRNDVKKLKNGCCNVGDICKICMGDYGKKNISVKEDIEL